MEQGSAVEIFNIVFVKSELTAEAYTHLGNTDTVSFGFMITQVERA